ncbi:MAG: hypothetical protein JW734_09915 [Candidatus Omnitrophica bacterium]|nr:hypothetical protein [Candidatus Omnitrophota bacterium]
MDKEKVLNHLKEAALKDQKDLSPENIFRRIGFDEAKGRLGWFVPPDFKDIEDALSLFLEAASGKEDFIFVGMGGSVNGVKTLIELTGSPRIQALDSLDTQAIDAALSKIKDLSKCLVCAVSKSGTTKETQLIATSLRDVFKSNIKDNFLWIADPGAFEKLSSLGWADAKKIPIQVNRKEDIGGRFTSPCTLIFLAPLIIVLDRDMGKMNDFWSSFTSLVDSLRNKAFLEASRYKELSFAKFQIEARSQIAGGISNWIIQLFQESLGSKAENFSLKSVVLKEGKGMPGFNTIKLDLDSQDMLIYTASLMYYLEVFVALLSYFKKINFVDQPYVEVYKKELKNLEGKNCPSAKIVDLESLAEEVKTKISSKQQFIDCVLYFQSPPSFKSKLYKKLCLELPDKFVSVFEGSDWNHHSYQAAFKDNKTFFIILTLENYKKKSQFVSKQKTGENIEVLKAISYATFLTLQDKSLYAAV